ncbi:MAG TPA: TadE family protein [Plantibacter sp.]|uniref:TadE family protein n=1 Tax=unclassified Plantibacter TaxID=2624265 RepID=UPI002D078928|nr:TadE family protein [Plantibacter sp.]
MPSSSPCPDQRHRPSASLRGDDGSASLEFITVGLVLLVPLVYLVVAIAGVQGAVLAADGAATQAAKLYARAGDDALGRQRAEDALALTLLDFSLDREQVSMRLDCAPSSRPCGQRGGTVTVTVTIPVTLPLAPDLLAIGRAIPVVGTATAPISRFGDHTGDAE